MQILWQYPEFLAAVALGSGFLLFNKHSSMPAAFAHSMASALPHKYLQWLSTMLVWAGWRSDNAPALLSAWKLYPPLLTAGLAAFVPMALVLLLALVLFFAADLVVYFFVRKRQAEIAESLPQAIDLMLLCVDAGLGFDATLARLTTDSQSLSNALEDELRLLSRDILFGMQRQSAYGELYARTGVEDLRIFGAALNQSTKLGTSIASVLRVHAEFMRNRQQSRAQERAAKLPVWMAFPLWFCIMPALLLILLGPSLILFISQAHPLPEFLL